MRDLITLPNVSTLRRPSGSTANTQMPYWRYSTTVPRDHPSLRRSWTSVMSAELVEWLSAIWDEDEEWAGSFDQPDGFYPDPHEVGAPAHHDQILARIAADRQILVLHLNANAVPAAASSFTRGQDDGYRQATADVLRLLAQPHADRPGFREEWRS